MSPLPNSHPGIRVVADAEELPEHSAAIREIYGYWNSRRQGRPFLRRADIDPGDIRRLLSSIALLDAVEGGGDFIYRLVGTQLCQFSHADYTGMRVSEVKTQGRTGLIFRSFVHCFQHALPVLTRLPYIGPRAAVYSATTIVLPLSRSGEACDALMLLVDFGKLADKSQQQLDPVL